MHFNPLTYPTPPRCVHPTGETSEKDKKTLWQQVRLIDVLGILFSPPLQPTTRNSDFHDFHAVTRHVQSSFSENNMCASEVGRWMDRNWFEYKGVLKTTFSFNRTSPLPLHIPLRTQCVRGHCDHPVVLGCNMILVGFILLAVACAAAIVVALLVPPILAAVGFSAAGVVAGKGRCFLRDSSTFLNAISVSCQAQSRPAFNPRSEVWPLVVSLRPLKVLQWGPGFLSWFRPSAGLSPGSWGWLSQPPLESLPNWKTGSSVSRLYRLRVLEKMYLIDFLNVGL